MLERMAKSVAESGGLVHQLKLRGLRSYIKTTSEEELARQIAGLKDIVLLRTLWEAGLSSRLQAAVLIKLSELT